MAEPEVEVPQEEGGEEAQAPAPTFDVEAIETFYGDNIEGSDAVEFIASKLGFTEYTTNVKEAIQAELHEHMLTYSKTCGLSAEQTAAFIGLFTTIIDSMKEGKSQGETEKTTKVAITGMCETVPNFNSTVVKFMLEFLAQTVFQHYNLYSHVYRLPQREKDEVNVTLEVETARIPPLSSGELEVEPEDEPENQGEEEVAEGVEEGAEEAEPADGAEEPAEEEEPNPVNEVIESEIERRVSEAKSKMEAMYAEREEQLLAKIREMTGELGEQAIKELGL